MSWTKKNGLGIADYDFETAETLYSGGRWLYVAFMCYQVIEKTLKAYWCATREDDPPYTHNLVRLASGCGLSEQMSQDQSNFVDLMVPMNIEARYPSYKEALSRGLNQEFCSNIISKTKELQLWIKSKLWV